jgi:hypothetical protein
VAVAVAVLVLLVVHPVVATVHRHQLLVWL